MAITVLDPLEMFQDTVLYYTLLTLLLSIVTIMSAIQTENFEYYTIAQ